MNDYYNSSGALRAAEDRLLVISKELEASRKQIEEMRLDYDAAVLRGRIEQINQYDHSVQMIIAADPLLQEAWDNFRVQYQLTARKELLETAREKIAGKHEGRCHACQRQFGGSTEDLRRDAENNILTIKVLERRVEELATKLGKEA